MHRDYRSYSREELLREEEELKKLLGPAGVTATLSLPRQPQSE